MIEREIAWRVFAHEFNHSDYFFHQGDERAPNYLVSPTGAKINRLYFVGVLIEIDNIGVGEDIWRGRVSDPTGAFTVYAGQYQPEAAVFLSGLDIPSFIAVVGKSRIYEPEEGSIYTSVRPEELNTSEAGLRDRWIVDTARLTFERIRLVQTALKSSLKGEALIAMLKQAGANAELADGISLAVEHYSDLARYLDTLNAVVIDALRTLLPADQPTVIQSESPVPRGYPVFESENADASTVLVDVRSEDYKVGETPAEYSNEAPQSSGEDETIAEYTSNKPDDPVNTISEDNELEPDEIVYELLGRLDTGKGVPVGEMIDKSKGMGLTDDQVNEAVKVLMSEGKCYEPRIGLLRKV